MNLLWFLVALILIAFLVSIIWNVFNVGSLTAGMTRTQRLLVALLGLLVIVIIVWWFFTRFAPMGIPF